MGRGIRTPKINVKNTQNNRVRANLQARTKQQWIINNIEAIKTRGIDIPEAMQIATLSAADQKKYLGDRIAADAELKKKIDEIFNRQIK